MIPEVGVKLGVQPMSCVRIWAGYTCQYVSNVVRPGDQIDRGINPTQAPSITGISGVPLDGPARPVPMFRTTDFWAQGLILGLELRF